MAPAKLAIGKLLERLTIQSPASAAIRVASLTRSGTTATATTQTAHGYTTNDYVTIAGATPAGYNGKFKITVTGTTTFTFSVSSGLSTPATGGLITATYDSDAQGGRRVTWTTVVSNLPAELVPKGALERLQAEAIQAQTDYRFRIRVRSDVGPTMRALWTPRWPPLAAQKTLEIHGVLPVDDGRVWQHLECGVIS